MLTVSFKDWWWKKGEAGNNRDLDERQELTADLIWQVWKARNSWSFKAEQWSELEIVQKAWENGWNISMSTCSKLKEIEAKSWWQKENLDKNQNGEV